MEQLRASGTWRRGIGSIVALVFIIAAIIIVFSLIYYSLSLSSKLSEIESVEAEAAAEKASLSSLVTGTWRYDPGGREVILNITNNHAKPVAITGVALLYSDGSINVFQSEAGLPQWLPPGGTLTIRVQSSSEPTSVAFSAGTVSAISSISANKYVPPPSLALSTLPYNITLTPVAMDTSTTTTIGYELAANLHFPATAVILEGTGSPSNTITQLYHVDGETYNITGVEGQRLVWLEGWQYRRPVIITNNAPTTLYGYQVRIELNSTNFDFTKANPDGSDIRVLTPEGNQLAYWIEEWNAAEQRATIWVKVPTIPASQTTTVYIYYGNPQATSTENPEEVFEFFDHFDGDSLDLNKWAIVDEVPEIENSLCTIRGGDSVEAIRTQDSFSPPFAIHYKLKPSRTERDWDSGVAVGTSQNDLLGFIDDTRSPYENYLVIANLWWRNVDNIEVPRSDYEDFHEYQVVMLPTGNKFRDLTDGRENVDGYARTYSGYVWLVNDNDGSGNRAIYDWVFVRKYVEPEPTVEVGEEETRNVYVSDIETGFTGVPSNLVGIELTATLSVNVSNSNVIFMLWNGSSWEIVFSGYITAANQYETLNFKLTDTRYVINGEVKARVRVENEAPFDERIDQIALISYTPTKPVIYAAAGGTNKVIVYNLETMTFETTIDAVLGGTPILFTRNSSITFDPDRNYLWALVDSYIYYYSIAERSWQLYGNLPYPAGEGCGIAYLNNRLYIVAGGGTPTMYIYDLGSWGSPPSTINLGFNVDAYGALEAVGTYIYIAQGGGSTGFYRFNTETSTIDRLSDVPTGYPVGLTYDRDRDRLWSIGRNGGIYYYSLATGQWTVLQNQIPYFPSGQGNRLEYYNSKLYHFRDDGTRELWIIDVSGT